MISALGYPVASLLAGLGIGGLAVALAAQGISPTKSGGTEAPDDCEPAQRLTPVNDDRARCR